MASSEDASVKVYAKQDIAQGHRYGPFKAKLFKIDPQEEVEMGQWKIYSEDTDQCYHLESNDFSIPGWLRFVKTVTKTTEQTLVLVQQGKAFFFEVTKDVKKGMEHGVLGLKEEQPPEPPPGDQTKRGRGRPRKVKLSPEEQAEVDEQRRIAKEEQKTKRAQMAKDLEESRSSITPGRSRKCVVCGGKFLSSILFMQHRRTCGVVKSVEGFKLDEEEEEEESEDEGREEEEAMEIGEEDGEGEGEAVSDEIQGEDGTLEGSMVEEGATVSILDKELVGGEEIPLVSEMPKAASFPWPMGIKRPRGRPRKDGLPPIPRKKRGRKRKRRGYDDDYNLPPRLGGKPGPVAGPPAPECEPIEPHPEKFPFTCDECRNSFPTESWYDLHVEQHANPQLQYLICNVCDEAFRFLMTYTNHMDEKHPGMSKREQTMSEKFRCDACKRAFRSPIHLERHVRKANNAEPPPKGPVQVKCKFCEKTFTMEQGLENHTVKAHPEHKRYQCTADDCIETFISKEERASHLANFHGLDPMHIYKCPVAGCSKAYTSVNSLNYHYALRHTLEKPFACEICGKTWVKIGRLREHMKTHSTEKNELCDECGRAFKTRPELKDHKMEAHTDSGKEKLQCRFCTATFSRRSSRSYHERKHRNEAPYVCPKPGCSKRFVAVIDYKRHLIYHTGAKLYRCRYCGNCFTRSDYLKGHEKRHILRGEQIDTAPPIEETVTIKVPWPMEKAVKIQGQNVVVSIEPDPSLAEGDMTAEALIALDHLPNVPVEMADGSRPGDIVQQAATQAMTGELQGTQLLQFPDGTTFATNSASAAIQEAVAQAQAQVASTEGGGGEEGSSEALPEATQILLQAAAEQAEALIQGGMDNTHITLEGATSEQAALVLQQLAAENAQVILHPSDEDGMSTMQATLQNENGETSIVVVNLATQPDGTVTAITDGGQQISLQTETAGNNDDNQTTITTEDGNMIITTSEALMNNQGEQITVTTVAGEDGVGENSQTASMVLPEAVADGGKGMIMVVQEEEETTSEQIEAITENQMEEDQ